MNFWEHPLYKKIKLEDFNAYLNSSEDYSESLCPMDAFFKYMGYSDTHTMMNPSIVLCDGSDWPFHYPGPKFAQRLATWYDDWGCHVKWPTKVEIKEFLKTLTG